MIENLGISRFVCTESGIEFDKVIIKPDYQAELWNDERYQAEVDLNASGYLMDCLRADIRSEFELSAELTNGDQVFTIKNSEPEFILAIPMTSRKPDDDNVIGYTLNIFWRGSKAGIFEIREVSLEYDFSGWLNLNGSYFWRKPESE